MHRGIRVLVVEDDADACATIRDILRTDGYEVDTAPDGVAAVQCAWSAPYDIVLTDLRLPGLNGLAVARTLRRALAAPKIILMTGTPDGFRRAKAEEDWPVLRKPVSARLLVHVVGEAVAAP